RDQGSIVREFVKWDFENRANEQLGAIVPRAFKIAMAEPRGPVYLSLPREWLYESMETTRVSAEVLEPPSKIQTPVGDLERAAEILMGASDPVIVTRYVGKTPAAVAPLVELADLLAIPVVQHPQSPYMNFPSSHPCHAGHDIADHVKTADVVFLVDIDVPWTPATRDILRREATVLQLEVDPLFSSIPVWGFPVDHAMTGSSDVTLPVLNGLVRQRLDRSDTLRKSVEARRGRIKAAHDETRAELAARIEKVKDERPIHPLWVSRCIADVVDEKTIVMGEAVTSPLGPVLGLERPGSFFDQAPAGHLGWGMGAAIGAKLAAPDHTVIACEGDGSYMFCVPTACHFTAQKYQVPFLTVIYNNQAWNATLSTVRELYPDGVAHQTSNFPGTDLSPSPQFELTAQACGAYAERVDDPADLPAALQRGLKAVKKEGRQALLNVICRNPAG
ncbi:MAG: thiamine pyrophosphate-requiring protein, partial [Gammaproteobacteria bacterium]|nr:thiamine pyrophosphate-requiring protein [Gammaproteobacteria bacterium]